MHLYKKAYHHSANIMAFVAVAYDDVNENLHEVVFSLSFILTAALMSMKNGKFDLHIMWSSVVLAFVDWCY